MGKQRHFRMVLSSSSLGKKTTRATLRSSAFDAIPTTPHHSVLNASRRRLQVNAGQAEANEMRISRRKQSLQHDMHARRRENAFIDKRIGEGDGDGSRDVMVERFAKERMRKMRKAGQFSLEEADDGPHDGQEQQQHQQLTHAGQALSTVHFGTPLALDDGEGGGEDNGDVDAAEVEQLHFGAGGRALEAGGEGRSKKDVMEEIIARSRLYRAEKAEAVAAQAARVSNLDEEFASIRSALEFKKNEGERERRGGTAGEGGRQDGKGMEGGSGGEGDDGFMLEARLLAEEAKVAAAERVKSAEEVANEEREKMERLEKARLRRMRGEEAGEEEAAGGDDGVGSRRRKRREQEKRQRRAGRQTDGRTSRDSATAPPTDDDLVENFIVDKETRRQLREREAQEEEEDEREREAADTLKAQPQAAEEDEQGDEHLGVEAHREEREEVEQGDDGEMNEKKVAGDRGAHSPDEPNGISSPSPSFAGEDAVPFIFPAPTSYKHFLSLLAPYPPPLQPLIYRRIHSYHFLALTADNRGRMETFFSLLLHRFHHICRPQAMQLQFMSSSSTPSSLRALLLHLDALTSCMFDLLDLIPSHAAAACRQLLSAIPISVSTSQDLLLSKLLFELFPTSDARHNVITPLLLHLASTLTYPTVRNAGDAARALFTCQLLLHAVQDSRRYVPEVLNTLYGLVVTGWALNDGVQGRPQGGGQQEADKSRVRLLPVYSKVFTAELQLWNAASGLAAAEDSSDWRLDLLGLFVNEGDPLLSSPPFLCSLFALTLRLIAQSCRLYAELPSYPELFSPFHSALVRLAHRQDSTRLLPDSLSTLLMSTISTLSSSLSSPRPGFSFLIRSIPSLRQHTPAFIADYQPGRDYDPVKERAEIREMGRRLRREKRGAEKELRRDAEFVRAEQERDREATEKEQREKRKRNFRDLELQAADSNLLHKQSKKRKKK